MKCEMGKTGGVVPKPSQGLEAGRAPYGGVGPGGGVCEVLVCWRGNKPVTPARLILRDGLPVFEVQTGGVQEAGYIRFPLAQAATRWVHTMTW